MRGNELAYFFNEHKFPFYLPFSIRFNMVFIEVLRVFAPIHVSATAIRHRFDLYVQQRYESHLKYHTSLTLCVYSACGMFVCDAAKNRQFWQFTHCVCVFGHFYYHLNRFDHFRTRAQHKKETTRSNNKDFLRGRIESCPFSCHLFRGSWHVAVHPFVNSIRFPV